MKNFENRKCDISIRKIFSEKMKQKKKQKKKQRQNINSEKKIDGEEILKKKSYYQRREKERRSQTVLNSFITEKSVGFIVWWPILQ